MVSSESNKFFQLPMLACFYIWNIYGFHVNASVTRERYITKAATQGTVVPTSSIHIERKSGDFLLPSHTTESTLKIHHPHPLTVKLMFFAEAYQKSSGNSSKIQPTISNGTTKSPPSSKSSYDTDSDLMPLLRPPPNFTKDDWPKLRYKPVVTSTIQNITSNVTSRRISNEFLHQLPPLSSSVKRSVTSSQIPFNPIQDMLRNVGAGSRTTGINQRPFTMTPHNKHGGIVDMDPVRRMLAVRPNNQQRRGSITPLARILSDVNKRRDSINHGSIKTSSSLVNLHFHRSHQTQKPQQQTRLVQSSSNTNSENGQSTMQQHNIRIGSNNFGRYDGRTGISTINSTIQGNEETNRKKSIPSKSHNFTGVTQGPDRAGRAVHLVSADDGTSNDNPFRLASRYAQKFEFARAQLRKNVRNSTVEQSVQISIDNPGHHTLQEIYAKQVDKPISLNHSSINQRIHQSTFQRTSNLGYTEHSNTARTYFYIPKSQTRPIENHESSPNRAHVASYTLKINQTQPRIPSSSSSISLDKAHVASYAVPTSTVNRTNASYISQKDTTMPIYHTISLFNRNKEGVNSGNGQVGPSVKPDVPTNYAHQRNVNAYTHTNKENDASLVLNTNSTTVKTTSSDGQRQSAITYPENKQLAVKGIRSGSILQTGDSARVSDLSLQMRTHEHELLVDHMTNNNSTGNKSYNRGMETEPGYGTYQKDVIKSEDILETQKNKGTTYFQSMITTTRNKPTNQTLISRDQMPHRREPESSRTILILNSQSTTPTSDQRSQPLPGINLMDSTRKFHPDIARPSMPGSIVSSPVKASQPSQPEPLKLYEQESVNQSYPQSLRLTNTELIPQTHQSFEESHQHLLQSPSLDSVPQTHLDSQVDSSVHRQSRVHSLHPLSRDTQGFAPHYPDLSRPVRPDSVSQSKQDSGRSINTNPAGLGSLATTSATSQQYSMKLTPSHSDSSRPSTLESSDLRSISLDSMRSSQFGSVSQPHLDSARPSHQNPKLQLRPDSSRPPHLTNLDSPLKSHQDMIQSSGLRLAQTSSVHTVLPQTTNRHQWHEGQHHQHSQSIFDQFLSGALEGPYSNPQTNLSVISDGTPVNSASNQEQVIYGRVRGGRMTERISDFQVRDPSTDIIDNSSRRAVSSNLQGTPEKDLRIFSGHYQPLIPVTADKYGSSQRLVDSVASGQYKKNPNAGRSHLISSQRSPPGRPNSRQEIAISPTIPSNYSHLPGTQSFSNNDGTTIHQPHSDPVASLRDDSMLDFLSWLVDAANVHYNISTETSTKPPYSDYLGHNNSQQPSGQVSSQLNDSTLNLLKFIAEYNSSSVTGSEVVPMTYQNTNLQPGRTGSMSGPRSQHPNQLSVTTSTTQQPPKTSVYTSTTPNPQETIQRLIATLQQAVAKQNSIDSSQVTVSANRTIDELVVKTVNSIVRIQALKSLDCRAVSFLYTISFMEYLPMRCDKSCPALTKCMNVGSIGFCCPINVSNHMIQMEIMKATTSADNDMLSV